MRYTEVQTLRKQAADLSLSEMSDRQRADFAENIGRGLANTVKWQRIGPLHDQAEAIRRVAIGLESGAADAKARSNKDTLKAYAGGGLLAGSLITAHALQDKVMSPARRLAYILAGAAGGGVVGYGTGILANKII